MTVTPRARQRLDVGLRDVDAVGSDRVRSQQPQRIEVFDRRTAVAFAHDADLVTRLGDMGHQPESVFVGQFLAPEVLRETV